MTYTAYELRTTALFGNSMKLFLIAMSYKSHRISSQRVRPSARLPDRSAVPSRLRPVSPGAVDLRPAREREHLTEVHGAERAARAPVRPLALDRLGAVGARHEAVAEGARRATLAGGGPASRARRPGAGLGTRGRTPRRRRAAQARRTLPPLLTAHAGDSYFFI